MPEEQNLNSIQELRAAVLQGAITDAEKKLEEVRLLPKGMDRLEKSLGIYGVIHDLTDQLNEVSTYTQPPPETADTVEKNQAQIMDEGDDRVV